MKLGYLVSQYPALNHSYVLREVHRLRRRGIDVRVVSVRRCDRPLSALNAVEAEEAARTFSVIGAGALHTLLANMRTLVRHPLGYVRGLTYAWRLSRGTPKLIVMYTVYFLEGVVAGDYFERHGVSDIHAHFSSTLLIILARTFRVRYSLTAHGSGEFVDVVGFHLAEKVAGASFIATVCQHGMSQVMNASNPAHWHKIVVLPLGVDLEAFRPTECLARQSGEPFHLVSVGRLSAPKGYPILIEAVALLLGRGRNICLTLVGDGPERAMLEKLSAQHGLGDSVRFVGSCNHDQVAGYYASSDAFVLSSFLEGVPVVLMEAMAMELPCIAPWITGIPEIIENDVEGLLVPPANASAIADAVESLMDDPAAARRLGTAARRKVIAGYDLEGNTERLAGEFRARYSPPAARKIRVCVAAPSLDFYAGQAIQGIRLMRALAGEPELEIGFIPHNPRLPRPIRWLQRVKWVRSAVTTFYYSLLLFWRLPRYDIIQVFSASYWSYLLSVVPPLLAAKLYRKKIILNYRSGEAADHLQRCPRTTVPLMKRVNAIVVPSGYLVDVFAKFGLKARSIFNIVDTERFKYRERAGLEPKFLCSRLLEPIYNVANVVRAFRLIKDEVPDATLTIAADGSQRANLEKLVADLRLDSVTFRGFVPFDKMPDLYDAHDVHLIGNDIDNMPAAITESCATGIIIVTTDAGGIPYIVENGRSALIVRCGDVAGLAREALRALRDPELCKMLARNARDRAQDFTWPRVRGQWLALYHELAGR